MDTNNTPISIQPSEAFAYMCQEHVMAAALDTFRSVEVLCGLESRTQLLYTTSSLFEPVHELLLHTSQLMNDLCAFLTETQQQQQSQTQSHQHHMRTQSQTHQVHYDRMVAVSVLHVTALECVFAFVECASVRSLILASSAASTLENGIESTLSLANVLLNNNTNSNSSNNNSAADSRSPGTETEAPSNNSTGSNNAGSSSTSKKGRRELGNYLMTQFNRFDAQIDKLLNQSVSLSDCTIS